MHKTDIQSSESESESSRRDLAQRLRRSASGCLLRPGSADFLVELMAGGLRCVELVASDEPAGLFSAIGEVIPEVARQRCTFNFTQSARSSTTQALR
ncbi:hypothetical protein BSQ44_12100 [Aquibium oceanicum]|uniref:Uncharacterized protein n=1 Tax=Aquibium oceanicum TaxID=1670800 RepID=A0A1L3SRT1_9HYPH|nr:hypothetical protein BSQ44_12100 [Aquibium oceanicum]